MTVLISTAAALVSFVVVLLIILYVVKSILYCAAHTEREIIDATVVALGNCYAIIRDVAGNLYLTDAEGLSLNDEIMVEEEVKRSSNGDETLVCMPLQKYVVSQEKGAKEAKILRRLNPEIVLCQWKEKEICVVCSREEQEKFQTMLSMVVGIKDNGNDCQVLKCEDVAHLPVSLAKGSLDFPMCRRV